MCDAHLSVPTHFSLSRERKESTVSIRSPGVEIRDSACSPNTTQHNTTQQNPPITRFPHIRLSSTATATATAITIPPVPVSPEIHTGPYVVNTSPAIHNNNSSSSSNNNNINNSIIAFLTTTTRQRQQQQDNDNKTTTTRQRQRADAIDDVTRASRLCDGGMQEMSTVAAGVREIFPNATIRTHRRTPREDREALRDGDGFPSVVVSLERGNNGNSNNSSNNSNNEAPKNTTTTTTTTVWSVNQQNLYQKYPKKRRRSVKHLRKTLRAVSQISSSSSSSSSTSSLLPSSLLPSSSSPMPANDHESESIRIAPPEPPRNVSDDNQD
eukprot:jgi/Psemu1/28333/gm1.28333_g